MNKLDVSPPSFTLSPVSNSEPPVYSESEPAPRLIVLFPSSEKETPDLEHRIWEIARSMQLNVLLLSLTTDYEEESQLRRKLVTMAAIIKDPNVSAEIMIEHGNDWIKYVQKTWRKGDIVACYAGQKVGFIRKSLDQVLRSSLETPIYILSDYRTVNNPKSTFISRAFFWLGSMAIIGGFLWAEMNIVQLPEEWTHTTLIYVCIFVEVALIWLWNSLFT
ncbi:MAG: hypothetical protein K8S20_09240 [Chloroflexi bacterium]|nr:hypothetical protein [Chloroflexota bacterium]